MSNITRSRAFHAIVGLYTLCQSDRKVVKMTQCFSWVAGQNFNKLEVKIVELFQFFN